MIYQNVRGLRTKTHDFYSSTVASVSDVICLSETWLNPNISNSELFNANKYNVFRKDRDKLISGKQDGGGVLIAVDSGYQSTEREDWSSDGICELEFLNSLNCMYVVFIILLMQV